MGVQGVKTKNHPKEHAGLRKDCDELKRLVAMILNRTARVPEINQKQLRRFEALAFEKAREMVLDGQNPQDMANPYEV